jgi:putative SOS response-associated peptidase YedK
VCGRFGVALPEGIAERFGIEAVQLPLEPRYNLAPTQSAPVVLEDGVRRLEGMRWGHEPRWLRERGGGRPLINARDDRLATAPTFREALRFRRAIVPASHFFEWKWDGGRKTPYLFRLRDGGLFGFAGLWFEEAGERRFVIVTTSPSDLTRPVHNRMPAILRPEDEDEWLDTDRSEPERLLALLDPYPADLMEAYPVSSRVNSPANDTPDLLEPAPAPRATAAAARGGPNPA